MANPLDYGEGEIVINLVHGPRPAAEFDGHPCFPRLLKKGIVKIEDGLARFDLDQYLFILKMGE